MQALRTFLLLFIVLPAKVAGKTSYLRTALKCFELAIAPIGFALFWVLSQRIILLSSEFRVKGFLR
jgi:hypothetical protein